MGGSEIIEDGLGGWWICPVDMGEVVAIWSDSGTKSGSHLEYVLTCMYGKVLYVCVLIRVTDGERFRHRPPVYSVV